MTIISNNIFEMNRVLIMSRCEGKNKTTRRKATARNLRVICSALLFFT